LSEANPLLRDPSGRFNPSRGALVKSSATGGFLLLQVLLLRKAPESRLEEPLSLINAGTAGVVAATAARNYRLGN
jgi:hypothetical protein